MKESSWFPVFLFSLSFLLEHLTHLSVTHHPSCSLVVGNIRGKYQVESQGTELSHLHNLPRASPGEKGKHRLFLWAEKSFIWKHSLLQAGWRGSLPNFQLVNVQHLGVLREKISINTDHGHMFKNVTCPRLVRCILRSELACATIRSSEGRWGLRSVTWVAWRGQLAGQPRGRRQSCEGCLWFCKCSPHPARQARIPDLWPDRLSSVRPVVTRK